MYLFSDFDVCVCVFAVTDQVICVQRGGCVCVCNLSVSNSYKQYRLFTTHPHKSLALALSSTEERFGRSDESVSLVSHRDADSLGPNEAHKYCLYVDLPSLSVCVLAPIGQCTDGRIETDTVLSTRSADEFIKLLRGRYAFTG